MSEMCSHHCWSIAPCQGLTVSSTDWCPKHEMQWDFSWCIFFIYIVIFIESASPEHIFLLYLFSCILSVFECSCLSRFYLLSFGEHLRDLWNECLLWKCKKKNSGLLWRCINQLLTLWETWKPSGSCCTLCLVILKILCI